jgi:polysaccharide export outer membrane protein
MRFAIWLFVAAGVLAASGENRGQIGPNDTVTITALNVEEISKAWRVGASGELNLPMVGRIKAAGMTVEQLETEIGTRLKHYVHDPQVTVFVSDFRSHPVTVSGAVEKPGVLQVEGPMPLFAVLVQAGGPKDAGPVVTLTRQAENGKIQNPGARVSADGKYSVLELALQDVIRGHGDAATVEVQPFDVVTVSVEKRQRFVFLSGEVNKPGAIELATQDTVSISKALAMAGGLTRLASAGKTMIRHINSRGQETAFAFVDLKKIMSGKAKDLTLSDGDVVIVPSSQLSTYLQTISSTAITSSVYILGRL